MARFDTVLVANRGEVACRIIESARALGLQSVAVYSDADRGAAHVRLADRAVHIGPPPPRESYLRLDRLLDAAEATGAGAIHPGYGFLSESAAFVEACDAHEIAFVGPTKAHLQLFGTKHAARTAAAESEIPLLPGSGLLDSIEDAIREADSVGWPVMVKATGGGGGIGIQPCANAGELRSAFENIQRVATSNFGSGGVYLERLVGLARHVEVQLFGDGEGRVITLGDRDCSLQRRNQKVIEEAPAPNIPDAVRASLRDAAHRLAGTVAYRSAGTVEFVYDAATEEAFFLEVNPRLQVEHRVTEAIYEIDLVGWMLRLANGDSSFFDEPHEPSGHAIEARVYAEEPAADFRPSIGLVTEVVLPRDVRVDAWVEAGTEVTAFYDPLLAKIIATGDDRDAARRRLLDALAGTRVGGIETNLGLLRAALGAAPFLDAVHSTATLSSIVDPTPRIEVRTPGSQTTVQDWPGRLGYWDVGVPPSGPMDDLSFRLGNRALGNDPGAPGLECVLSGPALVFTHATAVCLTGAPVAATVSGRPQPMWEPFTVAADQTLDIGSIDGPGLRTYVLVAGGFDVPTHLGSASTFTLGGFGGHAGRALRAGDVLHSRTPGAVGDEGSIVGVPELTTSWWIGVLEGPHGAPEFFTPADIDAFFAATWRVHYNSARTGVRLVGPSPGWERADGGEAGLHPSNIHDTPYATATVNFTGDTPILLGPDGPSLGGFVCPATVAISERWKLGQLRPGDSVTFVPLAASVARSRRAGSAR
ncbi:MAG TPA: 5-oxoprolinase/urea amidolyase family protein, partial [Acidimicrobiales bacterium]|nr:5-oxoprolinase/urea amidolyase family protein [Acidimicrobiales bacterium]